MNTQDWLTLLQLVLTCLAIISGTGLLFWQSRLYFKLNANQRDIEAKELAIDGVPESVAGRTSGTLTTDPQRQAQVKNEQQPLLRDLELLRQQREFIKDRLWFTK